MTLVRISNDQMDALNISVRQSTEEYSDMKSTMHTDNTLPVTVTAVDFSRDGQFLVSGSGDREIRVCKQHFPFSTSQVTSAT